MNRVIRIALVALATLVSLTSYSVANTNWRRVFTTYAAFSEADTSTDVTLFNVPNDGPYYVEDVILERVVDFVRMGSDASAYCSAVTVSIGDSGSATRYMAATDIFTGAKSTAGYTVGSATASTTKYVLAANSAIIARVDTTGCNTNALTAGKFALHIKLGRIANTGY